MPKRISDVFQIDAKELSNHNVFNGFIDIDSRLYVDPRLLSKTSVIELKNSYNKFTNHFNHVLKHARNYVEGRGSFETIVKKLMFPEIPVVGLGYSINNNNGKGIGRKLASQLSETVVEFVKQGILDPRIFELSQLFEENIGADRISDMTIKILLPELGQFSCRLARELNLPKSPSTLISKRDFAGLPCYSNQGRLLIPQDILTELPLAESSWTRTESITIHNEKLREDVNRIIGESLFNSFTWQELFYKKNSFKKLLIEYPKLTKVLLKSYKAKSAKPYDFASDPKDEFRWHDSARDYAQRFPLNLRNLEIESNEKVMELICRHFSKLVKNGLCTSFYQDSGDPNNERIGQLILLELLECYLKESCFTVQYNAKDKIINLSNINSGVKNLIYLKYTSSKNLIKFYEQQRAFSFFNKNIYQKDQEYFTNSSSIIQKLKEKIHNNWGKEFITIIVIIVNRGESKIDLINDINLEYEGTNFFRLFNVDCRTKIKIKGLLR